MAKDQSEPAAPFEIRAFGKDVFINSIAHALLLLFGAVQAILIPKILSVESYGYWHLFVLYSAYVGILHFGFNDGLLLRLAGKDLASAGKEIRPSLAFLFLEQLAIVIPLLMVILFFVPPPYLWIVLFILAYALINNVSYLFIYASQAVKRFKGLAVINVGRGFLFLVSITLLFILGYKNHLFVISALLFSYLAFMIAFIFWYRPQISAHSSSAPRMLDMGKANIKAGFFVLLGNMILVLFLTLDRILVSIFFTLEQFAVFAFALVIATIVYTFVRSVSEVFFPFISSTASPFRNKAYSSGESAIILTWAGLLPLFFGMVFIVRKILPLYEQSLPIMKILMCTVVFGSLIQILQINFFKLYRKQRLYFLGGLTALILSLILLLFSILIFGTLEGVAIAVLISFGLWYLVNEFLLKFVVSKKYREIAKTLLSIGCYIGGFWLSSILSESLLLNAAIYLVLFFLISLLFYPKKFRELVRIGKSVLKR